MSGLPMTACSERRPMLPVVHWITRSGRPVLVVLMGLLRRCDWTHYVQPAHVHPCRVSRLKKRSKPGHADREEDTADRRQQECNFKAATRLNPIVQRRHGH